MTWKWTVVDSQGAIKNFRNFIFFPSVPPVNIWIEAYQMVNEINKVTSFFKMPMPNTHISDASHETPTSTTVWERLLSSLTFLFPTSQLTQNSEQGGEKTCCSLKCTHSERQDFFDLFLIVRSLNLFVTNTIMVNLLTHSLTKLFVTAPNSEGPGWSNWEFSKSVYNVIWQCQSSL